MTDEKTADERRALLVRVPVIDCPVAGLRKIIMSLDRQAATGDRRVEVTSGLGLGDTLMHVEVEGHGRVLTVGLGLVIEAAVNEAVRIIEENAGIHAPPDRPDRREECVFGSSADRLAVAQDRIKDVALDDLADARSEQASVLEAVAAELGLIESILRANNGGGR